MCNQLGARMRKNGSCGGQERKHHKHETQNCAKARRHGAARSAAGMQAAGETVIDTSPESTTGSDHAENGKGILRSQQREHCWGRLSCAHACSYVPLPIGRECLLCVRHHHRCVGQGTEPLQTCRKQPGQEGKRTSCSERGGAARMESQGWGFKSQDSRESFLCECQQSVCFVQTLSWRPLGSRSVLEGGQGQMHVLAELCWSCGRGKGRGEMDLGVQICDWMFLHLLWVAAGLPNRFLVHPLLSP